MQSLKSTKTRKNKKEYDYQMHGIKIEEWFALPGIRLWIKIAFYLLLWQNKHPNKTCFISNKKIHEDLVNMGCICTLRGVESAMKTLKTKAAKTPQYYTSGKSKGKKKKDGVGLITCLYPTLNDKGEMIYTEDTSNILTKTKWISMGKNPNEYIFRKIYINYPHYQKYMSVFTGEHTILKNLPAKSRLKKFIKQRPISYTKNLNEEFNKHIEEALIERYKTPEEMFKGFVYKYSRIYWNPTRFIYNYIPEHTRNYVKEQNAEEWLNIDAKFKPSPPYVPKTGEIIEETKESTPSCVKEFYEAIRH